MAAPRSRSISSRPRRTSATSRGGRGCTSRSPRRRADGSRKPWSGRGRRFEKGLGVRLEVSFSIQSPATDTLALDGDGAPLRDARGALVFRPAGHGALLGNLAALGGDVVLVKNIDNVVPDTRKAPTIRGKWVLGGLVVERQREIFLRVARLRSPGIEPWALEEAATFVGDRYTVLKLKPLNLPAPAPTEHHASVGRSKQGALHQGLVRTGAADKPGSGMLSPGDG